MSAFAKQKKSRTQKNKNVYRITLDNFNEMQNISSSLSDIKRFSFSCSTVIVCSFWVYWIFSGIYISIFLKEDFPINRTKKKRIFHVKGGWKKTENVWNFHNPKRKEGRRAFFLNIGIY